jgi:UPF0755 protein
MLKRLALLLAVASMSLIGCSRGNQADTTVRVTIPRGATLTAVAETLSARGVIQSPSLFRLYARVTGRERAIQAGTYEFQTGLSPRQALAVLVSGRETLEALSIPEGLMLFEVAERVNRQIGLPAESLLAAARDSALTATLGVEAETLEGYLYPSTYYVRVGATASEVVEQMVREFEARWQPEWNARLAELQLSRHEVVTLASIIEGEVQFPPDGRYVSSVYHNRLARGMRLQADPTVIYALGRRRRLYERDYQTPSPYNTYLIDGLPPGPIGQPSESSIEAALYPVRTNFLYFVARTDGKHVFSRTYREHLTAVAEVRQMERELGAR